MVNNIMDTFTIRHAMEDYVDTVGLARSEKTALAYGNAIKMYEKVLIAGGIDCEQIPVTQLKEETISWFLLALKDYSPATERLYLTAVTGFYNYLVAEELFEVNMSRVRKIIQLRARRPGKRLPQFPKDDIIKVLTYTESLQMLPYKDESEMLRNLRDKAFILTLTDTGLRVHEACSLRRGDLDWNEGKAIIIGKGNRQDVVRFSSRSLLAIREYIKARSHLDGATSKPLSSLALFAQHSRRSGRKVLSISTRTGRNIVTQRVKEILGDESVGEITPHSFRHYFVTTILIASEGNLKLAQELARHQSISVTQRYAHLSDAELDKGYHDIFEDE